MARKRGSSQRWLDEHFTDPWVKQARREGWRGRAVYKLAAIDERDQLLQPGMRVIDLGAAPGGWSQYAAGKVAPGGHVIALDVLDMAPLEGVTFIQGDFTEDAVLEQLRGELQARSVDLVMSDMAPNMSGVRSVDQPRAMYLAELAQALAAEALAPGGDLLVKVFQGEGFDAFLKTLKADFSRVLTRKPEASRDRSREVYLLARNYQL